eukprot:COSAG02_NODE_12_length_58022_cov_242.077379_4_plen_151_part_00
MIHTLEFSTIWRILVDSEMNSSRDPYQQLPDRTGAWTGLLMIPLTSLRILLGNILNRINHQENAASERVRRLNWPADRPKALTTDARRHFGSRWRRRLTAMLVMRLAAAAAAPSLTVVLRLIRTAVVAAPRRYRSAWQRTAVARCRRGTA